MSVSVARCTLNSDTPIVGCVRCCARRSLARAARGAARRRAGVLSCPSLRAPAPARSVTLTPYLLLKRADASCTTEDASEANPVDGHTLRCRWYKSGSRVRSSGGFCFVHPGAPATLQSVQFKTFHCSPECFVAAWRDAARTRGPANGASPTCAPSPLAPRADAAHARARRPRKRTRRRARRRRRPQSPRQRPVFAKRRELD
jgi:hypothetical protein